MPVQAAPIVVDVTSRVKRPVPPKEILWPTVAWFGNMGAGADSSRFPGLTAIKARYAARPAEALETFLQAVRDAQDRVLVLDDFLFHDDNGGGFHARLARVMSWLPDTLAAPGRAVSDGRAADTSRAPRHRAEPGGPRASDQRPAEASDRRDHSGEFLAAAGVSLCPRPVRYYRRRFVAFRRDRRRAAPSGERREPRVGCRGPRRCRFFRCGVGGRPGRGGQLPQTKPRALT